jgi:hypothetical protein
MIAGWPNPLRVLEYAFSSGNPNRWFFPLLAVSFLFSLGAGAALLWKKLSRLGLGVVLVGGVAQCLAYLASSIWVLAAMSAVPLFWVGRDYRNAIRHVGADTGHNASFR